jgi:hypothetical protein
LLPTFATLRSKQERKVVVLAAGKIELSIVVNDERTTLPRIILSHIMSLLR